MVSPLPMSLELETSPWVMRCDVRAHDLDRSGTLSPVALVRLTETHRWHVFAGPLRGLFGRIVVRAQSVEMYSTMGFGKQLDVHTWLARVGRSSVTLGHDVFEHGGAQRKVGSLAATLVATDDHGKPTQVGPGARSHVIDRACIGGGREFAKRPSLSFVQPVVVQLHDLDLLQHVNQARYVEFTNGCRHAAAAAGELGAAHHAGRRVSQHVIAYESEATLAERLLGHVWPLGPDTVSVELLAESDGRTVVHSQMHFFPEESEVAPSAKLSWQE